MNHPSDQDYLDDLLHRASISSSRSIFTKRDDHTSNFCTTNETDNIVDSTLVPITKSEANEIDSLVSCDGGLGVENPNPYNKDHFKFATQCPEISSQKGEKKTFSASRVTRKAKEPPLNMPFPSKLLSYELKIIKQPEEQHRARYLTEGSRGTVKDKTGQSHPTVKLIGCDQPVTLQVFVGSDSGKIKPHGFYQACKVSHKNSSACVEKEIDGTAVIELPVDPKSDMVAVIDCVGVLKLRNADVEQRIGLAKSKKKSTIARLVFRVNIPKSDSSYHTLQVSSTPILCTQPTGAPEISKKSLNQCTSRGGEEMFIIGKNFMKGTTVYFEEVQDDKVVWSREAEIDQDFFQSTHLVCTVPPYIDLNIKNKVEAQIVVNSSNRTSEPVSFTYLPRHNNENKPLADSSSAQSESIRLQMKPQADPSYLKRTYTSSDVSPEELNGVPFVLNVPEEQTHLTDPSISIGVIPSKSPHIDNSLLSSPIILLPKEMTSQPNTLLDSISPNLMPSSFRDESVNLSMSVAIPGEEALEHELVENGEPRFKRVAHNLIANGGSIQAYIDLVNDENASNDLTELTAQKQYPMMWSQDMSKSCVLGSHQLGSEGITFAQELHSFSPAPLPIANNSDSLLLEFNKFEAESPAQKNFLTLSSIPNPSGLMESFSDNMTFIHNMVQNETPQQSSNNQLFLLNNKSVPVDPRMTELSVSEFLKLNEKMNIDGEQSFRTDFLLSEKVNDSNMGYNLQQSLSELKNLTSQVGMSSVQSQEEDSMSGFVDRDIVSHIINVDQKFMYQPPISDASQHIAANESSVFKNNVMNSFPPLSTSYEMVSDLRNFGQPSPFNNDLCSETPHVPDQMSFDDKTMMTIGLMNQHRTKSQDASLASSFTMMETHSDSQNIMMNHQVPQGIDLNTVNESICLSHANSVDEGSLFQASPKRKQIFSEKSLDQSIAMQFRSNLQNCIMADSSETTKTAEQSELFYLLTEDVPGNILAPLTQQNQISPLPNLTIEEVSQVLNMSGS